MDNLLHNRGVIMLTGLMLIVVLFAGLRNQPEEQTIVHNDAHTVMQGHAVLQIEDNWYEVG